ncbi:MAG: CPBP family intramembrane metalloprotease [Eubacteriaceae bacterium]|nr:CPBP family intramembrane metalloprotease [Eubacteriaceae bacterium]
MKNDSYEYSGLSLKVFFALVISLSLAAEVVYCLGGPGWSVLVLMWIPALSALAALIASSRGRQEKLTAKETLRLLGLRKCPLGYILAGMLIPLVYLLIPYMVYWRINPENFAYNGVKFTLVLSDLLPVMLIGNVISLVSAAGEEIGWRGFMLPALTERFGEKKTLFLTGLIWALWHLPLLIWGGYMAEAALWYRIPAFILCIVPIGIIAGILTYRSGSVWPAAFLHAAHNNYDQSIFDIITRGADRMYFVSETGMITILCAWVIALALLASFGRKSS